MTIKANESPSGLAKSVCRDGMDKLLLEEYKTIEAEIRRLQQFRHGMGLLLLAASGVTWAFALNKGATLGSALLLLPAVLSFGLLVWIIRYVPFVEALINYRKGIIEPWFGAGRLYFEGMAINKFKVDKMKRHLRYSRWQAFFLAFPFQHIIIWTSAVIFAFVNTDRSLYVSFCTIVVTSFLEAFLLIWYIIVSRLCGEDTRFWLTFRDRYKGCCPDSFRLQSWEVKP